MSVTHGVRKQPLFYSEVINFLKNVFPPENGYHYRDDFDGDLFIVGYNILRLVEIKSESEMKNVSTERGGRNPTFRSLREKIHSLSITQKPNGKYAGWLCYLAQLQNYLERMPDNVDIPNFEEIDLLFSIPYNRYNEFVETLAKVNEVYGISPPISWKLIHEYQNFIILVFKRDLVDAFFQDISQIVENS